MKRQSLYENNPVAKALSNKWGDFLTGITNEHVRMNTAVLLETQYQKPAMITEDATGTYSGANASSTGFDFSGANGAGAGNDIAPFQHYLLPLVRRVYPNLIANELVGVQPMTSPASLVFYLKYKYTGLVNPDVVENGRVVQKAYNKGRTAPATEYGNFVGNSWNIDPYYSTQTIFRERPIAAASSAVAFNANVATVTETSLIATPLVPGSVVFVAGNLVLTVTNATGSGTLSIPIAATGLTTGAPVWTAGTSNCAALTVTAGGVAVNGALDPVFLTATGLFPLVGLIPTLELTLAGVDQTPTGVAISSTTTFSRTYDYNMEGNRAMPEMELQVESFPVSAKTRKLRTKWTIEAAQDLRAMHNIDAEQELISVLANEVTAEIDREIINDLIVNAEITVDYDYSNPFLVGGITAVPTAGGLMSQYSPQTIAAGGAGATLGAASYITNVMGSGNFEDRNKALFYQVLEVSNQIYRQSLRGAGNWIVTSPEVASKLESLLEFKPDARTDTVYNLGIIYSGTLNGQFKVYKDPLFNPGMILVGYKGSSFMDAGYFYCPYVPLQLTPTVLDTESFNPRKGLITRYGKVLVENGGRMYGRIRVANMGAIGANQLPGADQALAGSVSAQANSQTISNRVASSTLI
jgi:hypothetical protein